MKYIGKIIKTETKELEIIRESRLCVFVKTENAYKDIAIVKDKLTLENDTINLFFSISFNKVITHTEFQLKELGFDNAKARKQEWMNSIKR